MEDFLYILLGVGWLAYSIYSQSKKKQKQKQSSTTRSHDFESEEESSETPKVSLFESLFSEAEQGSDVFDPYKIQEEPIEPIYKSVKESDELKLKTKSTLRNNTEIIDLDLKHAKSSLFSYDDESENEYLEDFDLKKAIIYAEIINNPRFERY